MTMGGDYTFGRDDSVVEQQWSRNQEVPGSKPSLKPFGNTAIFITTIPSERSLFLLVPGSLQACTCFLSSPVKANQPTNQLTYKRHSQKQ